MSRGDTGEAAAWLLDQHAGRARFMALERIARDTLTFAYDVQDAFQGLRRGDQTTVGYKIGLTTPRMQAMCGLDHPIAGEILSGGVRRTQAMLRSGDYVRLGLECEVAVRLGKPLDGRAGFMNMDVVRDAVAEVAAAFEIIEDRAANYARLDMPNLIADNSWNAGVVLGAFVPAPDLADRRGRLFINGAEIDAGSTRDVLGHPFNSVAWVVGHLAERGRGLEAGQIVMTGSIVLTRFPQRGDIFRFEVDGLPPVEATVG